MNPIETAPILHDPVRCAEPPIYLEGFGWLGCVLAWHLRSRGHSFVWHDDDRRVNAWGASAGCVMPAADERVGYGQWREWLRKGAPWGSVMAGLVERGTVWINDGGGLKRAPDPSLHVNVPEFVRRTRSYFEDRRVNARPEGSPGVVAHGWGSRLVGHQWGWTAVVTLTLEAGLVRESGVGRAAFRFKSGKHRWRSCYPLAGDKNLWLAGGEAVPCKSPIEYETDERFRAWAEGLKAATSGRAVCSSLVEMRQGWRPCGSDGKNVFRGDHTFDPLDVIRNARGDYELPSCGDRGVRLAPVVLDRFDRAAREMLWTLGGNRP